MLKIPWNSTSHKTSILRELKEPVKLNVLIEKRILEYFEHDIRRDTANLEKGSLFGKARVREEEKNSKPMV